MIISLVHVHVKPDFIEEFKKISLYNAQNSIKEPGVARFDVLQQKDDPNKFVLVEVFRNEDAPAKHRETEHYQKWRDTVAEMMAEPRQGIRYQNLFPDDEGWG